MQEELAQTKIDYETRKQTLQQQYGRNYTLRN
jgi:hypothetical protein